MKVKRVVTIDKTDENLLRVCSPRTDIFKFYQVMEIIDADLNIEQYPVGMISVDEFKAVWANPMAFILEIEVE